MSETASISSNLEAAEEASHRVGESLGQRAIKKLMKKKFVVLCFAVTLLYLLIAILGYLNLLPDFQQRVGESYEAPSLSWAKLLGTDIFGRSILYKVLTGTKTAMTIGISVTAISIPLGLLFGVISGYYGGKVDAFIVWAYSVLASIPYILLVIGISYVLGKGVFSICVAMGAVGWVGLCRLVRGEVMKHKSREYVLAINLLGGKDGRVMFKHIMPNIFHLAIITASLSTLNAIKSEVILTFLGVGVQDGSSWGTMIQDASGELVNGIWWPLLSVTVAMFLIIYALNVIGDALRDALDPKLVD
ncbi:ABC transporter permease [Pseudobacteriovorax antillogorgiicola]|uniref:Peptide/nickel transport system permease protein n=1 Tax=Pseudobacteriovorax antillogorgiicola TaxID=1513793 RepID=A0A1Y6CS54_9BACT|nr:ABC transporter permease [Pseudobacteriovorax antillogorgiicola]TCS45625.1 peptide/nickel transport system permease protein [Pseudobacteriovorax antillogorgiicola]SMF72473.1 peptide/nickel transport system permease protein [Pseudobacteriovorax antillogorgiicola]